MNEKDKILKAQLRKKLKSDGFESLSDLEIIELILTQTLKSNYEETASELIEKYHNFYTIADSIINITKNNNDLNEITAAFFKFIPLLSRRYFMEHNNNNILNSSSKAKKYFENYFIGATDENFTTACTNEKFKIIECKTLSSGTVQSVSISCRQIVDFAIQNKSSRIFIAHNHPNSSAEPSAKDLATTDFIASKINTFGIRLIDHIIAGKNSVVSLQEYPEKCSFKSSKISGYNIE